MERKVRTALVLVFLQLTCWQFNYIAAFFGGAWCPYKADKLIPCRIHNGTESYLGPNICWRNFNGTFSCTKRMLTRPKFVTTYKRVSETIYKCCPGLQGHNCQTECFNCTTIQALQNRLGYLETKINQVQVFPPAAAAPGEDKTFGSGHRDINKNSIGDDDDEDFIGILNIANDLRDLDTRLMRVEAQLAKLIHSFDEWMKAKTIERAIVLPSDPKVQSHSEESPGSSSSGGSSSSSSTLSSAENVLSSTTDKLLLQQRTQRPPARLLESNLERGDIASTLNDDYGDEIIFANPTEEYADQLYNTNSGP